MGSFAYLQSVMARYGDEELLVVQHQERIATTLTYSDVESLAAAHREIDRCEDWIALNEWIDEGPEEEEPLRRQGRYLLILFNVLARRNLAPFSERPQHFVNFPEKPLDWTFLPDSLRFLISAAERYGKIQFDSEIGEFLEKMTEQERRELLELKRRVAASSDRIERLITDRPMTQHKESARIYFMMNLLEYIA